MGGRNAPDWRGSSSPCCGCPMEPPDLFTETRSAALVCSLPALRVAGWSFASCGEVACACRAFRISSVSGFARANKARPCCTCLGVGRFVNRITSSFRFLVWLSLVIRRRNLCGISASAPGLALQASSHKRDWQSWSFPHERRGEQFLVILGGSSIRLPRRCLCRVSRRRKARRGRSSGLRRRPVPSYRIRAGRTAMGVCSGVPRICATVATAAGQARPVPLRAPSIPGLSAQFAGCGCRHRRP